jgi:hypothetical protein
VDLHVSAPHRFSHRSSRLRSTALPAVNQSASSQQIARLGFDFGQAPFMFMYKKAQSLSKNSKQQNSKQTEFIQKKVYLSFIAVQSHRTFRWSSTSLFRFFFKLDILVVHVYSETDYNGTILC